MAKLPKHMILRKKTYAVRVPVPKGIQEVLEKPEITRTLKTRDLSQAKKNYHEVMAQIYKLFDQAKAKLNNPKPASMIGFYPLPTVQDWYHVKKAALNSETKAGFGNEEHLNNHIKGLKEDLAILTSNKEQRYAYVEFVAHSLLESAGYACKPNSSIPNIDFTDPKYYDFLEHLVAAMIHLKEFELQKLGVMLKPMVAVDIYNVPPSLSSSSQNQAITPLSKLISEYMNVKGSTGKSKTISDKYSAFNYLIKLVGEDFFIENLNREHFLQIRELLKAYPKNATKMKVLKGKSLQEVSDFAVKNKLPLMSKQNANKIIARLKSLMEYAVSTDVLQKNPCVEIKFHISQAEKDEATRQPYNSKQLTKLFSSLAFDQSYPKGPALYWAPLLALFHGFRMEEILLLTLKEIRKDTDTGIHYFDLTGFTTEDVKNSNAIRRIPFHSELKDLGFHEYLKKCEQNKSKRLFPELKKSKGLDPKYSKEFSKTYGRYARKIGVYTKQTVFHSFRRNFAVACLNGKVPIDYENCLAGWSLEGGQKGTYKSAKDASIEVLKEMIDKISYPKLDLSHLYLSK